MTVGSHLVCLPVAINAWCLRRSHSFRHGWHFGARSAQVLLTYQQQRGASLVSALVAQSKDLCVLHELPDMQTAILFQCHNICFYWQLKTDDLCANFTSLSSVCSYFGKPAPRLEMKKHARIIISEDAFRNRHFFQFTFHFFFTEQLETIFSRNNSCIKVWSFDSKICSPKGVFLISSRFIFWLSDGVIPSIQRADINGEMDTTVLKIPDQLETLSIDYSDRRLFWIQQGSENHRAIGSCDYNGNIINVFNQALQWVTDSYQFILRSCSSCLAQFSYKWSVDD